MPHSNSDVENTQQQDSLLELPKKKSAKERLEYLQTKQKIIRKKQSSVTLLVARYDVEQSFFDKASIWYGSLGWWKKALIAVAATSASILAAAVSPLSIVASIFCGAVGLLTHFVLSNHHRIGEERLARIKADIIALEKDLSLIVEDLIQTEEDLKEVLIALSEEEIALTTLSENYKTQVEELEAEVTRLKSSGETLDEEKENLLTEIEGLQEQLTSTKASLASAQESIAAKVVELEQSQQELSTAQALIKKNAESLAQVESDYSQRVSHLQEMEALMQTALEPLQELNLRREEVDSSPTGKSLEALSATVSAQKKDLQSVNDDLAETDAFLESLGLVIDYDDSGVTEGKLSASLS